MGMKLDIDCDLDQHDDTAEKIVVQMVKTAIPMVGHTVVKVAEVAAFVDDNLHRHHVDDIAVLVAVGDEVAASDLNVLLYLSG